jgi:predicted nucleic acid-binding protein
MNRPSSGTSKRRIASVRRFREKMTTWLDDALVTTIVLAADETTTRHYAEIRLQLVAAGTPIPMNDLWIAAIARQHDLPVISRDAHFDQVKGLTRIGW